ncbi:electron transport complex subunit RsxG [Pseudothauera rhizosphaerae]|uniref:Ion-translocating oxidoreductase complex subunit G n=1 Tax=Pseudothauera rhizosphaerae TaxID=2565932 RepID=A0A4S4ASR3_9RHOO|nr:electron transport complex subunit RsxG [Pseudothauera rhizosphaerae]THF62208.1 electron transport complex subunit RsxG [Pseudothauera rhizosphaerae]
MNIANQFDTLWYQGLSLAVVATVAGTALAVAYQGAAPRIAEAQARKTQAALAEVLPKNSFDNELMADTVVVKDDKGADVTVYRARKDGTVNGVVFAMGEKGYSGTISLVMGVDRDGRITGVRITGHTETPGLGDKIEVARHPWVLSFDGKFLGNPPPEQFAVKKDGGIFDQFAGATITPRAVVKAVKRGLELYAGQRAAMLGETPAPAPAAAPRS